MIKTETIVKQANYKINESVFLLCDRCLWTVTCLNKIYLEEIFERDNTCPVCKYNQLSSFPITTNDSFTYNHSMARGLEITFGIK
jgi:hypothetical protein